MSADLPQLRILRYAPPLTMLSYPFLFLPSRFPSNVIYPPTHPHFSLSLSLPCIGPCFAFIYPPRVLLSLPSFPFSLLKPPFHIHSLPPFLSLSRSNDSIHSRSDSANSRKRAAKRDFQRDGELGYFKQLLSAFLPLAAPIRLHGLDVTHRTFTTDVDTTQRPVPARSSPCLSFIARFGTSIHPSPSAASRPINQQAQLDRVARLKSLPPFPSPFFATETVSYDSDVTRVGRPPWNFGRFRM